jgi:hypothetical protein
VVSLGRIRAELGVKPTADQRPVVAAAFARARDHLRAGQSFGWNATNTSRRLRQQCVGPVADYRGRGDRSPYHHLAVTCLNGAQGWEVRQRQPLRSPWRNPNCTSRNGAPSDPSQAIRLPGRRRAATISAVSLAE